MNSDAASPPQVNGLSKGIWVSEYGEFSMKGRRDEMEDAHSIEQNQRFVFLAVFDGHDGKDVSEFMGKNLWKYFTDSPHLTVEEKLATAAQRCERQMLVDRKLGGSTAAVCVFDKIDGILHVWNVGDSEIMIVPDTGAYLVLSEMHRGETPSERQRIERIPKGSSYIKVEVNRVNQKRETRVAGYGVSRAFGDFKFGKMPALAWDVISAEGYYRRVGNLPQSFSLVIFCDGLAEGLRYDDIFSEIRKIQQEQQRIIVDAPIGVALVPTSGALTKKSTIKSCVNAVQSLACANAAMQLANASYAAGSTDNISVIFSKFRCISQEQYERERALQQPPKHKKTHLTVAHPRGVHTAPSSPRRSPRPSRATSRTGSPPGSPPRDIVQPDFAAAAADALKDLQDRPITPVNGAAVITAPVAALTMHTSPSPEVNQVGEAPSSPRRSARKRSADAADSTSAKASIFGTPSKMSNQRMQILTQSAPAELSSSPDAVLLLVPPTKAPTPPIEKADAPPS